MKREFASVVKNELKNSEDCWRISLQMVVTELSEYSSMWSSLRNLSLSPRSFAFSLALKVRYSALPLVKVGGSGSLMVLRSGVEAEASGLAVAVR